VTITKGVLQLHSSPLLTSGWTKEDIIFVPHGQDDKPFRRPYIASAITNTGGISNQDLQQTTEYVPVYVPNITIFALGILLIEICLDQSLEQLRAQENLAPKNHMCKIETDYDTAIRLLERGRILDEYGEKYDHAVRRCIRCNFDTASTDLENSAFRQAVHNGVLAMLEGLVIAVQVPRAI
jgi:hypothetical protein